VQFLHSLFLIAADLLDEVDRRVVDTLLGGPQQLLAPAQRLHLSIERRDLRLTAVKFCVIFVK